MAKIKPDYKTNTYKKKISFWLRLAVIPQKASTAKICGLSNST